MILVCDAYRKDLQHPNEFVRGSTLRFLCKLKEPELLEPLMPAIISCLEHRHSYVRRNAVCAIFTIYRKIKCKDVEYVFFQGNFEFLIPDAPELVYNFLEGEQDASCKRNAFMMLLHVDQARALDYLSGMPHKSFGKSSFYSLYIQSFAVIIGCRKFRKLRYEAAGTLVTLSSAPAAIKAAASAYVDLIVKESDNNVKLIVLDRLMELRQSSSNEKVLQELVMDILRVGVFLFAKAICVSKYLLFFRYIFFKFNFFLIYLFFSILQRFLLDGDFFLGASLATVLYKLAKQFTLINTAFPDRVNHLRGECMFILACIINLGRSGLAKQNITEDDLDRLLSLICIRNKNSYVSSYYTYSILYTYSFFVIFMTIYFCVEYFKKFRIGTTIKLLAEGCPGIDDIYLGKCRESLELMLLSIETKKFDESVTRKDDNTIEVDKTITFTQLSARTDAATGENLFDLSLSQALGTATKTQKFDFSRLVVHKIVLFMLVFCNMKYILFIAFKIYAENILDVLIVNQTADTLQNLSLELSTVGDLKLVDKPTPITLAPADFANIKATVKVASTENGVIFSTISYDVRGSTSDRNCVYLQDIRIDIMDYIVPGNITDTEFRQMWFDFEWENKVTVNTPITSLREFLTHLSASTNMKILTGDAAIEGDCGFLAANLCAHSIFGEDALANVSIEKAAPLEDGSPIVGHIRIRAKSQGMALTLGDKINVAQRERKTLVPVVA
uniref:Coatomer subunit beta n=1 Tax=Heterorhabditis bacteriophora TaxID=37862 RepID=A0A1I7XT69_HETBA